MLKQIRNITILGGIFSILVDFELLPSRIIHVYGRNDIGKSTIARCIKRLGREEEE